MRPNQLNAWVLCDFTRTKNNRINEIPRLVPTEIILRSTTVTTTTIVVTPTTLRLTEFSILTHLSSKPYETRTSTTRLTETVWYVDTEIRGLESTSTTT